MIVQIPIFAGSQKGDDTILTDTPAFLRTGVLDEFPNLKKSIMYEYSEHKWHAYQLRLELDRWKLVQKREVAKVME